MANTSSKNGGNEDVHDPKGKYFGMYRARVVEVDVADDGEKNKFGAVRVFIPDVHVEGENPDTDPNKSGVLAYPANTFCGGYNDEDPEKTSYYCSSVIVPP